MEKLNQNSDISVVSILPWHCRGTAAVLPRYCRSTAVVLPQYCRGTAAVLPQYCRRAAVGILMNDLDICWSVHYNILQRPELLSSIFASFLINFSGDGLGYLTVHCFEYASHQNNPEDPGKKLPIVEYYSFFAFPIMAMAFLGILVHYLKKPATSRATKAPDAELILLGICAQFTVWHAFPIFVGEPNKSYNKLCADRGAGSWSDLFAISGLLATLTIIKTRNSEVRKARAAYTFLTSGVLNLLSGGAGRLGIVCLTNFENLDDYSTYSTALSLIYACVSMLINALVAFKILTYHLFIKESPTDEPEQPEEGIDAQTTRNVLESICSFSICN